MDLHILETESENFLFYGYNAARPIYSNPYQQKRQDCDTRHDIVMMCIMCMSHSSLIIIGLVKKKFQVHG